MARGADRVAHVVQAVEHRHEVVAGAAVRRRRLRSRSVTRSATPASCGALARGLDRAVVVVGADERRVRERLGHQDRRGAVAAADVGDAARRARACRRRRRAPAATRRPGARCSRAGRTARSPRARRGRARASRVPSPLRAASTILRRVDHRAERDLEEARAGTRGCPDRSARPPARAAACSGRCRGRSRRSRPPPGRSATRGRSARRCRCARPAPPATARRLPASARYRPSLSPITTSAAFSVAPTSSTARNTNCISLSPSTSTGCSIVLTISSWVGFRRALRSR